MMEEIHKYLHRNDKCCDNCGYLMKRIVKYCRKAEGLDVRTWQEIMYKCNNCGREVWVGEPAKEIKELTNEKWF